MAGVLARGFLRNGYPVVPVTRTMNIDEEAAEITNPVMVVVAVAEKDFPATMKSLPGQWQDRLVLIQNELLPRDWQSFGIDNPTIISVWFEKKKGMDYNPVLPSPMYGPMADLISESLGLIDIPCRVLTTEADLVFELVLKNVFVFTINIAGLVLPEGTTTSGLWKSERQLALDVAYDIIDIQEKITGKTFSRDQLVDCMVEGFNGDPHHKCRGRSAPGRLERSLQIADELGLDVKSIKDISQRYRR